MTPPRICSGRSRRSCAGGDSPPPSASRLIGGCRLTSSTCSAASCCSTSSTFNGWAARWAWPTCGASSRSIGPTSSTRRSIRHRRRALIRDADGDADIFATLDQRDLLVHHPYDSFALTVQAFIEQAASDPSVLAIKQTLYRTSGESPIVDALIAAAEAGKQVVVLVEIKARFDEQANIAWARMLERAGCHVVYGLVGLKTHCKLLLVVRNEPDGIRRYVHIGTGNYHPTTATLYEDIGLLTTDPVLAADVSHLFNLLTGYSRLTAYDSLLVAPLDLRQRIVSMIEEPGRTRGRRPTAPGSS